MRLPHQVSILVIASGLSMGCDLRAQGIPSSGGAPRSPSNSLNSYISSNLDVIVTGADGKPLPAQVMVQLLSPGGQLYDQASVKNGVASFTRVPKTEFRVLVIAPGYHRAEKQVDLATGTQLAKISVELQPMSDVEDAAADKAIGALNPQAQKEVGKALEALRKNKTSDAYAHLQSAQKQAPNSAEVEYLLGVYLTQANDPSQARVHFEKTLEYDPNHLSALLEVAQGSLTQNKTADAMTYVRRALTVEPSSWRAHALLAEADYMQGNRDEAIKHAERAIELGHEKASSIEPFLAGVVAESGDKDRAIRILEGYLKVVPSNAAAAKQLDQLKNPPLVSSAAPSTTAVDGSFARMNAATLELPVRSNWLPTDVDERIPPVEPGAVCSLDEVLQKTGDQLVGLIHNVERFTATESVLDESINKWGVASLWEKKKFNYLVSIQEMRPGLLSVDEYRTSGGNPAEFPDGFITNGLPALVMVFHPYYVANYEMTCEGLSRRSTGLAWQVHFRQRPDKAMAIRGFRVGAGGSSFPVAIKGRAWISSDDYQIVRLETDLVKPAPEIHLVAEHTAIEYGSVNFREGDVNLWLPHSAEVHFDWMGRRIHRRHIFDNYLLFSVDEHERVGAPKAVKSTSDARQPGAGNSPE